MNDGQRRRLAAKAKGLGRKLLAEIATVVTPETLLSWHRQLIAHKYYGSGYRGPGRPRTAGELEVLVVQLTGENQDWGVCSVICNVRAAFGNAGCGLKSEFSRRREEMDRLADQGNEGNPVFGPYGNEGKSCIRAIRGRLTGL